METLVIRSASALVNPPPNTPTFSALGSDPVASFDVKSLTPENTLNTPVKTPFLFTGISDEGSRTFDALGSAKAPLFSEKDGVPCLKFDGTMAVGQSNPFTVNRNFTVGIVFSVDSYENLTSNRVISIGTSYEDREYITVTSKGVAVMNGNDANNSFTDTTKKMGLQCIVAKFNGAESKCIDSDGNLNNATLNDLTKPTSSYLRMGSNVPSAIENAFKGNIAGWKIYQDDLSDTELIELHKELSLFFTH